MVTWGRQNRTAAVEGGQRPQAFDWCLEVAPYSHSSSHRPAQKPSPPFGHFVRVALSCGRKSAPQRTKGRQEGVTTSKGRFHQTKRRPTAMDDTRRRRIVKRMNGSVQIPRGTGGNSGSMGCVGVCKKMAKPFWERAAMANSSRHKYSKYTEISTTMTPWWSLGPGHESQSSKSATKDAKRGSCGG